MSDLPEDFHALLRRLDSIAAEECPDATPYASHYRVLEILQKLRTTALPPAEMAIAAAKLGATYLAVEEPHHAQPALEEAGNFFFPGLVTFTTAIVADDGSSGPEAAKETAPKLLDEMPQVEVKSEHEEFEEFVVELLNQLGVLWSNRSRPLRALCYLSAAQTLCDKSEEKKHGALAAALTHTHFYLAQVYGSLGMAGDSARFCLSTLELQLLQCVHDTEQGDTTRFAGAHEWVRNALKLVEFYLDTDNPKDAATCLKASEYMLLHHGSDNSGDDDDQKILVAEIYSTWSRLHVITLQLAGMRRDSYSVDDIYPVLPRPSSMETTLAKLALSDQKVPSADEQTKPTGFGMEFVPASSVETFDQARDVFKMGLRACTRARELFVLDGFVTQHVRLLQRESALYKRLLPFEDARGRQVAMHRRRLALLTPMLGDTLNERAFSDLLQELYFECAEVNADVFELKRSKEAGEKAMAYATKAIQCYQQFLLLYYPSSEPDGSTKEDPVRVSVLCGGKSVPLPSEAMSPKEFRTMLLGYFGLAHACGKVTFPSDTSKTVGYWRQSLAYHEAVVELVRKYEQKYPGQQGTELRRSFQTELTICGEMAELLPEKINQLVYNGKAL
ncbi:KIF-1 binding protein [Phytophthora cinnamomi]|uniref:KIF-1 binding protein n=1 Tax=Phytophthora cinnamomi TaxID=4785 RepID=UPI0035595395|nr:KIF-1 binding protein [Phytophthora cinnamomi]